MKLKARTCSNGQVYMRVKFLIAWDKRRQASYQSGTRALHSKRQNKSKNIDRRSSNGVTLCNIADQNIGLSMACK